MPFGSLPHSFKAEWARLKRDVQAEVPKPADELEANVNQILLKRCWDLPEVATEIRRKRRREDFGLSAAGVALSFMAAVNILSNGYNAPDPPSGQIIDGCQISTSMTQAAVDGTATTNTRDIMLAVAESSSMNCSPSAAERVVQTLNPDTVFLGPKDTLSLNLPGGSGLIYLKVPTAMAAVES